MTLVLFRSFLALFLIVLATSCTDPFHDDHSQDEHDVITTVTLRLSNVADTNDYITAVWEDIDGIGGANPNRIDSIILRKGATYTCSVSFENRSVSPVIDVTQDINADGNNHQVFFDITSGLGQVTVMDTDSRNLPIGLQFGLATSMDASAVPGTFMVSLYHFDNESDKTGSNRGNETDIEVVFPIFVR